MGVVALTAFGVGGATIFGGIIGFIFKRCSEKLGDMLISFSAGVMLCAAIIGLILPATEGETTQMWVAIIGMFTGAAILCFSNIMLSVLRDLLGMASSERDAEIDRALLLVAAIAIHNFPEGIAAGVSFGCDQISQALLITGGIALQNIPEGMVIIAPMLRAGVSPGKTMLCAVLTGVFEIIGTFIGYFMIHSQSWFLPFALGSAGGIMLYIICNEMIPDTHTHGWNAYSTFTFIIGFCIVLIFDNFLG